jgi:sirohydrochlorin cobaltochelatase
MSLENLALKSIVLFAHGSRDPLWRVPMESIAQRIQTQAPECLVSIAYLELNEPDLKTCVGHLVSKGAQHLKLFPLFLGVGKHARHDLPLLVHEVKALYPQLEVEVLPSAGEMPEVIDFLAQMVMKEPTATASR